MKICHKYVKQQQNSIIFYNPYVLQERIKQYEKALSCYDDGQPCRKNAGLIRLII